MLDLSLIFDGSFTTAANGTLTPVGQAITATADSQNIIDLLSARDVGASSPLRVNVEILQTFATLTSLQISLQEAAVLAGPWYTFLQSPVYPAAQLVRGVQLFEYPLPSLTQLLNATAGVLLAPGRYLKLNYNVAGTSATAGSVFSYITPVEDRNEFWANNSNYTAYIAPLEV